LNDGGNLRGNTNRYESMYSFENKQNKIQTRSVFFE